MNSELTALAEEIGRGGDSLSGVVIHEDAADFVKQMKARLDVPTFVISGDEVPTRASIESQIVGMRVPRAVVIVPAAAQAEDIVLRALAALAAHFNVDDAPEVLCVLCVCGSVAADGVVDRLAVYGLGELVHG